LNLKDQAIIGVIWNGIGKFFNQAIQFLIMVILARLLTPADFGIVGIAFIFTRFITLLNEMGIAAAVVQKLDMEEKDLNTLFTTSLVVGIVLMMVMFTGANGLAVFFETPVLEPILKILSITFLIGSLGVIQKSLANRDVNFKMIASVEIAGVAFYGVVSIVLAALGFGVWSIVYGMIANHIVSTFIFYIRTVWKPKVFFSLERFKSNVKFGINVFGTNIVNYFYMNLVSFVTGKFLGTSSLGIYTLANNITTQTVGRISYIIGRVMFPTMSKIQNDHERFASAYIKVLHFIAMLSFPFLIGVAAVAKPFVLVLFGEKWSGSIFPLQVLAIIAMLRQIGATINYVLLAKGRSDIEFKWNVFFIFVLSGMLMVTIKHGLDVLVIGIFVINLVGIPVIQKITFSLIDLTLWRVYKTLLPVFVSSALMGVIVYGFSLYLANYVSNILILILSAILGVILFFGFMFMFDRNQLKDFKTSISESIIGKKTQDLKNAVKAK